MCLAGVGLLLSLFALPCVGAQPRSRRVSNSTQGVFALDTWIVSRYQHAQLLPDSTVGRAAAGKELAPRVETVVDAPLGDTLFAIQFRTRREMSSVRVGSRVTLRGPSGAITPMTADIVARRPFRAPRRPGADTAAAGWRYGWAYLAVVPRRYASTPGSVYRGWLLLLAGPDTLPRP